MKLDCPGLTAHQPPRFLGRFIVAMSFDAQKKRRGLSRAVLPMMSASRNLDRAVQRDPHAPGERNADEGPEQRGLCVQSAAADAERAGRAVAPCFALAACSPATSSALMYHFGSTGLTM